MITAAPIQVVAAGCVPDRPAEQHRPEQLHIIERHHHGDRSEPQRRGQEELADAAGEARAASSSQSSGECRSPKKGRNRADTAIEKRVNHRTMVGVLSVREICRMVMVTADAQRREQSQRQADRRQMRSGGLHDDQHAEEAERDRAPAMAADRLAEDQRRQDDREKRGDEPDRRRLGERQKGEGAERQRHGAEPEQAAVRWASGRWVRQAPKLRVRAIQASKGGRPKAKR